MLDIAFPWGNRHPRAAVAFPSGWPSSSSPPLPGARRPLAGVRGAGGEGGCSELGLVARFGVAGAQLVAAAALAAVAVVGHVGQRVGADQVPAGHSLVTPLGPPWFPDGRREMVLPSSRSGHAGMPHGAVLGAAAHGSAAAVKIIRSYFSWHCTAAKAKGKPPRCRSEQ